MKKSITLIIALLWLSTINGQNYCGTETSNIRTLGNVANGLSFTPKGDLRILIVFVSYGLPYDTLPVDGWPKDSIFPDWAKDPMRKPFYTSYSEFSNNIFSDNNRFSVSNFYYQMSNGSFRLIADYYPGRVVVNVSNTDKWEDIAAKAIQQISNSVAWADYDNRTNRPNFQFDNSTSQPDGVIDYVVLCHRYKEEWASSLSPELTHVGATGYAPLSINETVSGGYVVSDGYVYQKGNEKIIDNFLHESGHNIYIGPHYAGVNNEAGRFFYIPSAGWGMMRNIMRICAAGWERYILNWIPNIKASGTPSDITNISDIENNGIYILRDFITTGDAIRIRVPTASEEHQYLWLENHNGNSIFDRNINGGFFCNSPITELHRGLTAYVESYSNVKKDSLVSELRYGNGVRWLNRNGNYDFSFDDNPIRSDEYCENLTYPFRHEKNNPIAGQHTGESIRNDYDNNGFIKYSFFDQGNSSRNEGFSIIKLNSLSSTAEYINGDGLAFNIGDKVSISRNPCVINIPRYDSIHYSMGDYYLNGISFEVLARLQGSILVKIRLDDVDIDKNTRWTGASIVLTDITGDTLPDVNVMSDVQLEIDKSGTPNRHRNPNNPNQTSSRIEDFITPTVFTCRNRSHFHQEAYSKVKVKNLSTLVLEDGSEYVIEDHAMLNIDSSACLIVKSGATLRVKGSGHVDVRKGGYICIESGANIILEDKQSSLSLHKGYIAGTSPDSPSGCNCTNSPQNFATSGQGNIHSDYNYITFIQKRTYTGTAYETGRKVRAGYQVDFLMPYGNVNINNGADVIFDADLEVRLEPGFSVKQGAKFEARCGSN